MMSLQDFDDEDDRFEAAREAGWIDPTDLTRALIDVMNERFRQWDEEGFGPDHDDQHIRGELGAAAACYAVPSRSRMEMLDRFWPATWGRNWFKPTGPHDDLGARRCDLVKAGALILAEIERIDRRLAPEEPSDG